MLLLICCICQHFDAGCYLCPAHIPNTAVGNSINSDPMESKMSDTTSPFANPDKAAHEIVLELIKSGSIKNTSSASQAFIDMLNHYYQEKSIPRSERKAQ